MLREVYKPTLKYDYPHLDLNMLHFEKGVVKVNLRDKEAASLYNNQFEAFGSINKRFDLGDLPAGDYVFEIHTNYYTFQQELSIGNDSRLVVVKPETEHTKAINSKIKSLFPNYKN